MEIIFFPVINTGKARKPSFLRTGCKAVKAACRVQSQNFPEWSWGQKQRRLFSKARLLLQRPSLVPGNAELIYSTERGWEELPTWEKKCQPHPLRTTAPAEHCFWCTLSPCPQAKEGMKKVSLRRATCLCPMYIPPTEPRTYWWKERLHNTLFFFFFSSPVKQ